jgi:hypothetical protein
MEKHGGWVFRKTDVQDYECVSTCRQDLSHKEYGMDGHMTGLLSDVLGDNYGIPGMSSVWFDRSDRARCRVGEFETNKFDYVEAVDQLPITKRKVDNIPMILATGRREFLALAEEVVELRENFNFAMKVIVGLTRGHITDLTKNITSEEESL